MGALMCNPAVTLCSEYLFECRNVESKTNKIIHSKSLWDLNVLDVVGVGVSSF